MALPKFVQRTKTRSKAVEIKRDSYLEQLKIRKDNGMIKIITGIRRCGKSFLLFVLFHDEIRTLFFTGYNWNIDKQ